MRRRNKRALIPDFIWEKKEEKKKESKKTTTELFTEGDTATLHIACLSSPLLLFHFLSPLHFSHLMIQLWATVKSFSFSNKAKQANFK